MKSSRLRIVAEPLTVKAPAAPGARGREARATIRIAGNIGNSAAERRKTRQRGEEVSAMPTDWDELEPRKPATAKPRDLDTMSVQELKDYIAGLEAEIARAQAKIQAKESHRSGAAGLFKKG
jgi:uncharacterized small protein (DUF1192 family)